MRHLKVSLKILIFVCYLVPYESPKFSCSNFHVFAAIFMMVSNMRNVGHWKGLQILHLVS